MTPLDTTYSWQREQVWLELAERARLTIAELEAKIADCHNHRACPRCGAELGERCLPRRSTATPYVIKNPHRERWGVPAR